MSEKLIEIISGPNGSGKSTFAETLFSNRKSGSDYFVNSDTIARGLSLSNSELAAFQAGRLMLQSINDLVNDRKSFAFESTLSGKTWVGFLKKAIDAGYKVRIYFIYLERVSENIKRVKLRVQQGGHSVPVEAIRRRFPKAFNNFWHLYRPLANEWFIFNNSNAKPKLIHSNKSFEALDGEAQKQFIEKFLKGKPNGAV